MVFIKKNEQEDIIDNSNSITGRSSDGMILTHCSKTETLSQPPFRSHFMVYGKIKTELANEARIFRISSSNRQCGTINTPMCKQRSLGHHILAQYADLINLSKI